MPASSAIVCFILLFLATMSAATAATFLEDHSCFTRPKVPKDRRLRTDKLVVGTFNADFLFDGKHDPAFSPYHGDPHAAQQHLERVAAVVSGWDADILVLQEVENCGIVHNLANQSGSQFEGYLLPGTDHWTEQNVALLTSIDPHQDLQRSTSEVRYPLQHSHCGYRDDSVENIYSGVSKHFFTTFELDGIPFPILLLAAHLKAFPNDPRSCSQREAQAAVLQSIISCGLEQGMQVIVAGDLNDYSPDILDVEDDRPNSRVLSMLMDPNGDGDLELHDVLQLLSIEDRYTDFYQRASGGHHPACHFPSPQQHLSAIDHILMTDELWRAVESAWVNHSHNPCKVSDHWPLFVSLDLDRLRGSAVA